MRLLNDRFWIDDDGNIGLTSEFISQLGVIWAFIPGKSKLVMGVPFAHIESSKFLGPLRAPVNGTVVENSWFAGHPESIIATTPLVKVSP